MNLWYRFAALIIDSCTGREMNRYGGRRGIVTSIPWKSPKAFGSSRFIERRHRHRFDNNVRHGYSNFGARLAIQKEKKLFLPAINSAEAKKGILPTRKPQRVRPQPLPAATLNFDLAAVEGRQHSLFALEAVQ